MRRDEEQRAIFPAEEKNFRDFGATEGDLQAARFFLYSWGRSIEQGGAAGGAESLKIAVAIWPRELIRALGAAYMAVLHEMPKSDQGAAPRVQRGHGADGRDAEEDRGEDGLREGGEGMKRDEDIMKQIRRYDRSRKFWRIAKPVLLAIAIFNTCVCVACGILSIIMLIQRC